MKRKSQRLHTSSCQIDTCFLPQMLKQTDMDRVLMTERFVHTCIFIKAHINIYTHTCTGMYITVFTTFWSSYTMARICRNPVGSNQNMAITYCVLYFDIHRKLWNSNTQKHMQYKKSILQYFEYPGNVTICNYNVRVYT